MLLITSNIFLLKFLLKNEISEPVTYFTILEIIAKGDSKIGNIASKVGVPASHLSRYMQRLIDLDMIEKEVPITANNNNIINITLPLISSLDNNNKMKIVFAIFISSLFILVK